MGVNIYILDKRPVRLSVGSVEHHVGMLRPFWKITEMNANRAAELEEAAATAGAMAYCKAAIIADVDEMLLGTSGQPVKAHQVIGWDEGRTDVTDMGWDYLPLLGYGVRDPQTGVYALHEEKEGALYPIDYRQAVALNLLDQSGQLIRRGQPTIIECRRVQAYITGYFEADCTLDDGRIEKLLIASSAQDQPKPAWLVGKKPREVRQYPSSQPNATKNGIEKPHPK